MLSQNNINYKKFLNRIEIYNKKDFCPQHIFECGQVFCYKKQNNVFYSYPQNKFAKVFETDDKYVIETEDVDFFENYFDLKTDYSKIKKELEKYEFLLPAINFGNGIRILKQDIIETIISFIISANNNIKRITKSLDLIRETFGDKSGNFYSFPTIEDLAMADENFFKKIGCGYRSPYLVQTIKFLATNDIEKYKNLQTNELRENLEKLKGIGEKVANCILLFGYGRADVFPVDTWMQKVYEQFFGAEKNRSIMTKKLVEKFGDLSGYAQQYLFFWKRSVKEKIDNNK